MQAIMLQLFQIFVPVIQKVITDYKASHHGAAPTDAEIVATFQSNIDRYLAEGQAWLDAHPRP